MDTKAIRDILTLAGYSIAKNPGAFSTAFWWVHPATQTEGEIWLSEADAWHDAEQSCNELKAYASEKMKQISDTHLTNLDREMRVYSTLYASPHYAVFSITGLQSLIKELVKTASEQS
jgi:hypothetical protein